MKSNVLLLALACCSALSWTCLADDLQSNLLDEGDSLYDRFLANRLSIGAALSRSSMKKTHVPYDPTKEKNFLGNINNLDESDMTGIGIVIRYELCPYVAFQFSNDLHAELGMWNRDNDSRDANLVVDGNTYEVLLMYPIDSIYCTPYIGLGITDISCSIDYNNWWHLGWESPQSYDTYAKGSKTPRNNISRWMSVDEPSAAFTFSAGLTLQLFRHAQMDFFYRFINADDANIEFRRGNHGRTESWHMLNGYAPLECSTFGASVRFVF